MRIHVDIFSDTACPWCYLGKRRFELALKARPQYEAHIQWRAFEVNPDMPWEGLARPAQAADGHATLVRLGEAVGLSFRFDLIERVPNTRRSHLLIAHAAQRGRRREAIDRVMQAYFEEGCDIGEVEELVRLGVEIGLQESEARAAVVLRRGQDGIVAAERHASVLGITGVPAFLFERQYSVSGAQEVATYVDILDQVAELAQARESPR